MYYATNCKRPTHREGGSSVPATAQQVAAANEAADKATKSGSSVSLTREERAQVVQSDPSRR